MTKKMVVLIFALTIVLFFLSFFYVKNEICCMFASNRYRGFPYQVVSIYKETDDFEEAKKVYSLNDLELLNQGWELKVSRVFNPSWAIPFNIAFYLVISGGVVLVFGKKFFR